MTLNRLSGRRLKSVSVAWLPSKIVLGLGKSVAIVSTSLRLSGRAINSRRSGPEMALRMSAISVVEGGLDVQAATPKYGRSSRGLGSARYLSISSTVLRLQPSPRALDGPERISKSVLIAERS